MDINTLRSIVTVVSFLAFIGILFWVYSPAKARGFEEAAALPFREDDDMHSGGRRT